MDEQPSLGQFIWLVRRELQWAHDQDQDQPLRFEVDSVSLDLVVGADRSKARGGGLDLKVIGVGLAGHAESGRSRHDENTVHVVLTARDTDGNRWQVGSADRESPVRPAETPPGVSEPAETLDRKSSPQPTA